MVNGDLNTEITGIAYDSRKVKPGFAFVALRGQTVDGHDFIEKAIESGAAAIIAEAPGTYATALPWVHVSDTRAALALVSGAFHGFPARALAITGITGTNGKTTIGFLVHHLLNQAQMRCGLLGTVHYDLGGEIIPATHTTPESLEIQQHLATMRTNGCRALAMEVSSHALHQHRADGIAFKAAVFTNLTQDHLDYHGTLENYFDAKGILFDTVAAQTSGKMVINGDDSWGRKLINLHDATQRVISYGFGVGNTMRAVNVRYDATGTTFGLEAKGREFLVRMPLIGDFNVYNALAALGAADAIGVNFREAINHLKSAPQVPGRLERVSEDQERFQVYVDYAHTPDGLVNALKAVRALRPRRLITVFGCGGDRDRSKRPLMARAAELGSDICILTSDNPRTEDPKQILKDASAGFGGKNYTVIEDRREAIEAAINNAEQGDIVVIAGKGHEGYQDIQGVKHPFDDRRVAYGLLRARRDATGQQRLEDQRLRDERQQQQGGPGGNYRDKGDWRQ
ncbi:MAG: UDP-N-acetylmuramyl-tripeptide synthetase [Verrucomicrobiaceae bacterium]|nr:UDP-N-acetylmuramyl-tripeptide synthetase [Verrucomicrobiaceae bacterium]